MQEVLKACSNVSALGPDHITWQYLKHILSNNTYAVSILSLANAYLLLHHWPRHFKELVSVIIPILDSIKLKLSGNHLFNKLAQCVEQNNRPKSLGGIISRLA